MDGGMEGGSQAPFSLSVHYCENHYQITHVDTETVQTHYPMVVTTYLIYIFPSALPLAEALTVWTYINIILTFCWFVSRELTHPDLWKQYLALSFVQSFILTMVDPLVIVQSAMNVWPTPLLHLSSGPHLLYMLWRQRARQLSNSTQVCRWRGKQLCNPIKYMFESVCVCVCASAHGRSVVVCVVRSDQGCVKRQKLKLHFYFQWILSLK